MEICGLSAEAVSRSWSSVAPGVVKTFFCRDSHSADDMSLTVEAQKQLQYLLEKSKKVSGASVPLGGMTDGSKRLRDTDEAASESEFIAIGDETMRVYIPTVQVPEGCTAKEWALRFANYPR